MVREPCLASVLPCGGRIALGDACGQKMAALFLVGWMPFFERVLGCAFDLPVRVWCILEMSVIFFSAAIFVVFCAVCVCRYALCKRIWLVRGDVGRLLRMAKLPCASRSFACALLCVTSCCLFFAKYVGERRIHNPSVDPKQRISWFCELRTKHVTFTVVSLV